MVNHKTINLADPENDVDAVSKSHLNTVIQNLILNQAIKQTSLLI